MAAALLDSGLLEDARMESGSSVNDDNGFDDAPDNDDAPGDAAVAGVGAGDSLCASGGGGT